jgi:hypothetical protein
MRVLLVFALLLPVPAFALSPRAHEFMAISKELEPVQCEKRRLRRAIALAEIEKADATPLRKRFADLNRDPHTAKLEKRLAQLEPQLQRSSDPQDLSAISLQQREAFYRCD